MRFFRHGICFLGFILFLSCRHSIASQTQIVFNTTCTISTTLAVNLSTLFSSLKEFEAAFDCRDPYSLLNKRLSQSDEVYFDGIQGRIFLESATITSFLAGAFDPTIGELVSLWKIGFGGTKIPTKAQIGQALQNSGLDKTSYFRTSDGVIWRRAGGSFSLDYGACAKGYAIDLLLEHLAIEEKKIKKESLLINLGGNIFVAGNSFSGKKWRIGIQNPFSPRGEYCLVLELEQGFVSTSGIYERYFEFEGERYHHILDPKNGYPAKSGLASVSVIGNNGILCDSCSTGFFVLGIEESMKRLHQYNETHPLTPLSAIFITLLGEVYITEDLKTTLSFVDGCDKTTNQIVPEFFLLKR